MRIYKFVFSPTGTSSRIADAVMRGINEVSPCEVADCNITYAAAQETILSVGNIAVIAAPVYGGKMAKVAKERLERVRAASVPCVLIAVYGNRAFENALVDMKEFVETLGFHPVAAGAFIGEHSYSTEATPVAAGRPDSADIAEAESFGMMFGHRLAENKLKTVDIHVLHDEPVPEQAQINFRNFVKEYAHQQQISPRQYLPEVDTALCSACGICREVCPTGAITADCLSVEPAKCIKCCACVKACENNARKLCSPFAPILSANFAARKSPAWTIG